jgi:predicted GNAT superfamily acetyltransferase
VVPSPVPALRVCGPRGRGTGARGRGYARRLYDDLFDRAGEAGHAIVGCEVNSDPPNPASDAFHAALGFAEVGRAKIPNGKTVRYLLRAIEPRA